MADEPAIHIEELHAPTGHPSRAKQVKRAERRVRAIQLRRLGFDYRTIGEQLGVSYRTAWTDVQAGLKALIAEPAEDVRKLELMRLDSLWQAANAILVAQNSSPELKLKAIDSCLRVQARRAQILGLDAPQKVELGPWLQKLAEEQGLDAGIAFETAQRIVAEMGF